MEELTKEQIDSFITNGFVKVENAFPEEIADQCRAALWKAVPCDPGNPERWTQPVIRIGELGLEPFKKAANTPLLLHAFDQLAGKNNWVPRATLGSFPIRFPCKEPAIDTGWHVDASFPGDIADNYFEWRINIHSVYLCHPFIVHAAQDHRGVNPKFMAQLPLLTRHDLNAEKMAESYPVWKAIRPCML